MPWDLTSYFPAFNGPEMLQFKAAIHKDIAALRQRAAGLATLNDESASAWEAILLDSEDLSRRMSHLNSYVSCLASSDAHNEAYRNEEAELTRSRAELAKVRIELLRALKNIPEQTFADFLKKPSLSDARNYLNRLREEAGRAMSSDKEALATDLGIDGIQAWGQLYDTVSSKLEFDMVFPDGTRKTLPMSQRRSLMDNPDRRVRKAAFEGGNAAWQTIEDAAASALNAIAGTRLTLNRHRGVNHFLDIALFQAAITRQTLDAMFEALICELGNSPAYSSLQGRTDGAAVAALVRSRRAAGFAQCREAFLGKGQGHGRRIVQPRLSRSRRFFSRTSDRQKLGRLGAARGKETRRFLHQLDAEQGIANLHDLQRIPGRRPHLGS